jgi:hypothetical protein
VSQFITPCLCSESSSPHSSLVPLKISSLLFVLCSCSIRPVSVTNTYITLLRPHVFPPISRILSFLVFALASTQSPCVMLLLHSHFLLLPAALHFLLKISGDSRGEGGKERDGGTESRSRECPASDCLSAGQTGPADGGDPIPVWVCVGGSEGGRSGTTGLFLFTLFLSPYCENLLLKSSTGVYANRHPTAVI